MISKKKLLFYLALFWFLSFLIFISYISDIENKDRRFFGCRKGAEIGIVLSGGQYRLESALNLLGSNQVKTLFVSGMPGYLSLDEHYRLDDKRANILNNHKEKIKVGYLAKTLFGHYHEVDIWRRFNHFDRACIITSDYHIPRSELVAKYMLPEVDFAYYVVRSKGKYSYMERLKILFVEYNKLLGSYIYIMLNNVIDYAFA